MNDDLRYRDLLKTFLMESDADDILTTRIPWLCPDCQGGGLIYWMRDMSPKEFFGVPPERIKPDPCTHPNAPTIEDLLGLGEALEGARRQGGGLFVRATDDTDVDWGGPEPGTDGERRRQGRRVMAHWWCGECGHPRPCPIHHFPKEGE